MACVVLGLHLLGFWLLFGMAPGRGAIAIGTGLAAYTLGLRHAFDADHIAAIDNSTRKLMAEGKRPMSVGFWFSLGHCTVVLALAVLLVVGVSSVSGPLSHPGSELHQLTTVIGTSVSGAFLYLIAGLNLAVLIGIIGAFGEARLGNCHEPRLEAKLRSRGLMNRLLGRFTRAIGKPWHMYPVGLLFGLGFDTASEVALLLLAAGAAGAGMPLYATLCLPVLFAAGMSLLDTIDGSFMNFAYGWAFSNPMRKLFYNAVTTGLSVAIALVIGTVELGGLLAHQLGARGPFWSWLEHIDVSAVGAIVGAMFLATWVAALAIWHFGRLEDRWDPPVADAAADYASGV